MSEPAASAALAPVTQPLLELRDVTVHFKGPRSRPWAKAVPVRAVDGISMSVGRGETVGIVGESGSGKSTLGRAIVGLEEPTSGTVVLDGRERAGLSRRERSAARSTVQMIFQDPFDALNPLINVGTSVAEPLITSGWSRDARRERVAELFELMGFPPDVIVRYPHEFSGGQLQRVVIARALATSPSIVVCDEPTSALDVSTQASIINLLADLKHDLGLAYVFISHDLGVIRQLADTVAVIYGGRVAELGPALSLIAEPQHPYTAGLVSAIPAHDKDRRARLIIRGEPHDPSSVPTGCRFAARCPFAQAQCHEREPELLDAGDGRQIACHRAAELNSTGALGHRPG